MSIGDTDPEGLRILLIQNNLLGERNKVCLLSLN